MQKKCLGNAEIKFFPLFQTCNIKKKLYWQPSKDNYRHKFDKSIGNLTTNKNFPFFLMV